MSQPLPHDSIIPFKESQHSKKEQVAEMFDQIAGKYDFLNRFLSAGVDVGWRKKAIRSLKKYRPQHIIDIATGTGDLAIMEYKMLQPQTIVGIDISTGMLEVGREKIKKEGLEEKIKLVQGDSENLEFADGSFDAATAAFGVRNFENLEKGLAEMYRVLKPGGRLMIIEFSKPKAGIVKGFYKMYMSVFAPRIAAMFNQNKEAYKYLNKSAHAFPERAAFTDILTKIGFNESRFEPQTFGICCIYTASKP